MTNDFFNNPYFRPHISVDIIRVFFNFRFSLRKSQSQQKPAKKINYFTIQLYNYFFAQKTSLILRTSTHSTLKKICFRNTAKNLSHFTNVPANIWLVSKKKNICTVPFLDSQEMHSRSTLRANVCIFLYISV